MTAVSEGKSRDVPSRRSTGGEGRGKSVRGVKRLSPLIPRFHVAPYPTFVRDETSDGPAARRGRGMGAPDGKKRAGLYFPLTSERKRRSWSTRSSTNCLRGTGLGINLLLAPRLPLSPFRSFPAYRLLYSKLYQTSRDVRMRSLCSGTKKLRRI